MLGDACLLCCAEGDAVATMTEAVANLAQVRRRTLNFDDAWVGRGHAPLPILGSGGVTTWPILPLLYF